MQHFIVRSLLSISSKRDKFLYELALHLLLLQQITPFHQLMKHHLVDAGVFAFYLDDASGGVLTLGGTDPSHYSGDTLQWIPIAFPWYGFWELHLYHAIAVGGTATTTGSHTAIMDTGTTLIISPTNDVRQLAGDVGADCWFLHGFLAQTLVQHECTDFSTYDEFYYALVPCAGGLASNGGTVADPPEIDFVFGKKIRLLIFDCSCGDMQKTCISYDI